MLIGIRARCEQTKHVGTVIDGVYPAGAAFTQGHGSSIPTAVVNRTGESAIDNAGDRSALMQMLPGMRQVVSPFRHMATTFDGTQHAVGRAARLLPPKKDVLSVVLNRGVYDKQIKGLSVVADTHGGLYEPGSTCTSLHGPRCNDVKKRFASAVGYQIFVRRQPSQAKPSHAHAMPSQANCCRRRRRCCCYSLPSVGSLIVRCTCVACVSGRACDRLRRRQTLTTIL